MARYPASTIVTIDCQYHRPERAAAYLIAEQGCAAFVDNNTTRAVPLLLDALRRSVIAPEDVAYLIVTHVHLDHAGGTSALLAACPNATILCHPNAARHLINPARLVASATQVYGEELFRRAYGEILPIAADRIRVVEDLEQISLGNRTLTFLHTAGHARHHMCIHDSAENAVFTGDTFGVAYPLHQTGERPFVLCSTPPTDFDPDEACRSVARIVATGAQRAYLTHFGAINDVPATANDLLADIDRMATILTEAKASNLVGEELLAFCRARTRSATEAHLIACGITPLAEALEVLNPDIQINGQGIAYVAARRRA